MFDKYVVTEGSLRNVVEDGRITGFALDVRIAYYRGLNVSMVEGFDVEVDGRMFPKEQNLFHLRGKRYDLAAMRNEIRERWEMVEDATVEIPLPGGLADGEHSIRVVEYLRVSYVPNVVTGIDSKVLNLGEAVSL